MSRLCLVLFLFVPSLAAAEEVLVYDPRLYPSDGIKTDYDEFQDKHTILAAHRVKPANTNQIRSRCNLYLVMTKEGESASWSNMLFVIELTTSSWVNIDHVSQFKENEGIFLVDGNRVAETVLYKNDLDAGARSLRCEEQHIIELTPSEAMKLCSASKLAFQVGVLEMTFGREDLMFLRSFMANLPREKVGNVDIKTDPDSSKSADEQAKNAKIAEMEAQQEQMLEQELAEREEMEKRASSALRVIKKALIGRNDKLAAEKLEEVIGRYPKTEAAEEAQELLESLQ